MTTMIINLDNVSINERKFIADLETVSNNQIELTITRDADFTGCACDEGFFEMAAIAEDKDGNRFEITWIFEDDGRDLDGYDYSAENIDDLRLL